MPAQRAPLEPCTRLAGFDAHISKPVGLATLAALVEAVPVRH
jgi:hypothetical protein